MGTRAYIGMVNENGSVTAVYSHQDGYISWTGLYLTMHYNNKKKVKKLLSNGDIYSLPYISIKDKQTFENIDDYINKMKEEFDIEYVYLYNHETWFVLNNGIFENILKLINKIPIQK